MRASRGPLRIRESSFSTGISGFLKKLTTKKPNIDPRKRGNWSDLVNCQKNLNVYLVEMKCERDVRRLRFKSSKRRIIL